MSTGLGSQPQQPAANAFTIEERQGQWVVFGYMGEVNTILPTRGAALLAASVLKSSFSGQQGAPGPAPIVPPVSWPSVPAAPVALPSLSVIPAPPAPQVVIQMAAGPQPQVVAPAMPPPQPQASPPAALSQPPLGAMPPLPTTFAQLFGGAPGYQAAAATAARMAAGAPIAPPVPPAPGGWQNVAAGGVGGMAGGGGVGGAVGGAIGAAGGPAGAFAGAMIGRDVEQLGKAFLGLIPDMRDFAEQVNDSNRHLMGWNANIAKAFVGLQLGDYRRNMATAGYTEDTVVSLANSVNRMRDSLFPYQVAGANLRNEAAGFGSGFVTGGTTQLNWIPELVEGLRSTSPGPNGDLGTSIGEALGKSAGIFIETALLGGLGSVFKDSIIKVLREAGIMKASIPT